MIVADVVCREFIGRSRELRCLLDAARTSSGRRSALVVVRGDAGIGKSRLLAEFASAAAAVGIRTAIASSREYADAPYGAIVDALEALGARAALTAAASPLGELDDKERRFALASEQFAALAREAAPSRLAVAIEDVQWAGGGTIDLLRALARRLAGEPILFVATYRPDEVGDDSSRARALAALERDAGTVIALEPLSGDALDRMLRAMLRTLPAELPPPVLAEIRELADGRPLFAEELLRGVLERGAQPGATHAAVPTSIRATVRERLAMLAPDERDVLLHAAVVGRRFSARFLEDVGRFGRALVLRALRAARDHQLIVEDDELEGDRFAFRHALTREVVYGELLRAEARELHARVAAALARAPEADVAAIAEHAYRARDAEHAPAWNERAGDAAAALFAHADAARHYERALELAAQGRQAAELAAKAADAWYATGELPTALRALATAIEKVGGDDRPRVHALRIVHARVLFESGRYEESIAATRALAAQLGDDERRLRFEALATLAGFLVPRGRAEEALEPLRSAEALLVDADPAWIPRYNQIYGYALGMLGDAAAARERFASAIAGARARGDDDVLVRALNNAGNVELAAGTLGAARERFGEALAHARSTKNRRVAGWVAINAALGALLAGELDEARALLDGGADVAAELPPLQRWHAALALRLATLGGAPRDAERAHAEGAFAEALAAGDAQTVAALGGALALDALAEGRDDEAAETVRRALAATSRPDVPFWLLAAAGRAGGAEDRTRAAGILRSLARGEGSVAAAVLAALEAREALRRRRRSEATALAEAAAERFAAAGWRLDEADALELAGRTAEALARWRAAGAAAEVARLTSLGDAPRRRGDATLTSREREIVELVLAGRSSRAIAELLVISERTVEAHLASAYRKLGVSRRSELAAAVASAGSSP